MNDADPRCQFLLNPGDALCWKGDRYFITGAPLGAGGTAVLYPLRREGGADGIFALKECFPALDGLDSGFSRANGVIRAGDAGAQRRLDSARKDWEKEVRLSQKINVVSHAALDAWSSEPITAESITTGGQTYRVDRDYQAGEGKLFLLRREDRRGMFLGKVLASGGVFDLYGCLKITQKVLFALAQFHRAGILHGDLHPDNVYLADFDPASGRFSAVKLADLGSAQELTGGRAERPLEEIYVRPGFRPPESYGEPGDKVLLTPAYDLYQVGRLLLDMISGSDYLDSSGGDRLHLNPGLVSFLPKERDLARLGCPNHLQGEVQRFVQHLLAENPFQRYQSAEEAMAQLEPLVQKLCPQPTVFSSALPALNQDQMVPRPEQVRQLLKKIDRGNHVCFVFCIGGMGKTVFALQAAAAWNKRGGRAFFVSFPGSMVELFTRSLAFSLTSQLQSQVFDRNPSEQELCCRVLNLLDTLTEDDLLIIDDLYAEQKTLPQLVGQELEPAWKRDLFPQLCQKKCSILITTRYRPQDLTQYSSYELLPLEEAQLKQLMCLICPAARQEQEQDLLALIREVDRTTIMVRMMASLMRRMHYSAREILAKLRSGTLDTTPVLQDVKGRVENRSIAAHLKALFDLGHLGKWEKKELCYALLMGKTGLPYQLFRQACLACAPGAEKEQAALALSNLMDLEYLKKGEDRLLSIHALIRMTARETLLADDGQTSWFSGEILSFFRAVWKEGGSSDTRYVPAQTLQQVLEFCEGARAAAVQWQAGKAVCAEVLFRTGQLLQALGLYGRAQGVLGQAGALYRALSPAAAGDAALQSSYAQLLMAQAKNVVRWKDLNQFPQAVSYAETAQAILEKNGLAESYLGVKVLAVLGRLCGESQHDDLQELYYAQAFALAERLYREQPSSFKNKLTLADAYTNCSWNWLHKNRFAEAYQGSQQAIRLYEELMEESEQQLLLSDFSEQAHGRSRLLAAAGAYNMNADSARALRLAEPGERWKLRQAEKEALEKSMQLRSVLPQDHPLLVFQYQRLARFQCEEAFPPFADDFQREQWEKGIQLFQKALRIQSGPNFCTENKDRAALLLELAKAYQQAAKAALLEGAASPDDALGWLREAESALGEAAGMSGLSRPRQAAREGLVVLYRTFCPIASCSFVPDRRFFPLWQDSPFFRNLLQDLPGSAPGSRPAIE